MRSRHAAAIANHQTRRLQPEIIHEHDRSALIHPDTTVVYNERTAL